VGVTLGYLGRHDDALPHQQKALRVRKQQLQADDLRAANAELDVGVTLGILGRNDDALPHAKEAQRVRKLLLPADSQDVRMAEYVLGQLLLNRILA
jgi:tetratricopeptide (TPR) repeat protein